MCAGFTLSALSFMAFGYLVASLAPTARAASVGGQLLYMPMIFVSGATMPLSIMPDGIQAVSQWLPMTHIVILMQDIWFGRGVPMLSVWVLVGILVVGGALSARPLPLGVSHLPGAGGRGGLRPQSGVEHPWSEVGGREIPVRGVTPENRFSNPAHRRGKTHLSANNQDQRALLTPARDCRTALTAPASSRRAPGRCAG